LRVSSCKFCSGFTVWI